MSSQENYKGKQALLVGVVFGCFVVAAMNFGWMVTVGAVLAATAVALYTSTTQPASTPDEHHHH